MPDAFTMQAFKGAVWMPIFEYRCLECGADFESVNLPGRDDAARCPECGSAELKKAFSTFSSPRYPVASHGLTCCGREERCDAPPCDDSGPCCKS